MEDNHVNQNIIMENRKRLSVSGVKEVVTFDDETLLLISVLGKITVKGEGLHIESYNTESGDLTVSGTFHAVVYMSDDKTSGGFISRFFR